MDASLSSFMEGLELEADLPTPGPESEPESDLASELLSRHSNSQKEDDLHLCAAVGGIAQSLTDMGIARSPVAYFGAVVSSLHSLSRDSPSDPVVPSLLSFLSAIIPGVSHRVVRSKWDVLSAVLVRVLGTGPTPGLRCVAGAIAAGEKGNWEKLSGLYGIVVEYARNADPKVRKQAHSCLKDILQTLQGSPVLALASERLTKMFERCLLLAGGSNSATSTENAETGAKEVLYYLHALKDCLPLMSAKDTTTILKYCRSLLDLRHQIVTKAIMEILLAFCISSKSEVSSESLLDLVCSLALSVAEKENLADEMAFTARLLHIGTKKVYELDRQICIVKLPVIFNALGDILASDHTEAVFAATEALKGLISSCIDEGLVKQGVDQVALNLEGGVRKSGPTIIERICATLESLLGYRYNAVWDMSFQVLSAAFHQLGSSSSNLMMGTVRSLADLQNLPEENFSYRKQLHECVGSAIGAMGPKIFLSLLPLNLDAEDNADSNLWLIPILKQYTVGTSLSFFLHNIVGMARLLQRKSHELEKDGRLFSARNTEGLVYALWSLLPAFCNYPTDTWSTFKDLQEVLCKTLPQKPDLRGIICSSLQILIQQNKSILGENSLMPDDEMCYAERKAKERYTPQVAEENLKAISSYSSIIIVVLFDIYMDTSQDSGGWLQSTIRELASVSDKKVVKQYFNKFNELLEKASKGKQEELSSSMQIDTLSNEASLSQARALLLDLEVSLLPGLETEDIDVLFSAIKSSFQDEEGLMQKKAYKTLSIVLKECDEFLSRKVDELIPLMIEATDSCHFSAKRHRLDSLYYLIVHVSKDTSEQRKRDSISAFLTEVILALKEANKKTRNRAYELLVKIGHACGDEEQGGKKENLHQFFYMIAGGLAGEKPHMISAAVKGLARLAYEFSDLINVAYSLLPSSFFLLQRKNREIIKANLGLIKVLVAKSKADGLQMHLKMMVEGLLKWQNDTKNCFKAKVYLPVPGCLRFYGMTIVSWVEVLRYARRVKLILEMLVRKCGLDAVKAVMPEEHTKLLTNIRKLKERKERKAKSEDDAESLHTKTSISRQSRWNHTRIFSDFGDDEVDSDAENVQAETLSGRRSSRRSRVSLPASRALLRSKRKLQAANRLPEDLLDQMDGEPLDLLDRQRTRAALRSSAQLKRKLEVHDEFEVDPEGRLIVREDGKRRGKENNLSSDQEFDKKSKTGSLHLAKTSVREAKKRQKTSDTAWSYTGKEYTSGKAGGDVKKKDKLEPYAYWLLDRKLLNRRAEHKAVARKGMASVMKFAKAFGGKSASSALSVRGKNNKKKSKGRKV